MHIRVSVSRHAAQLKVGHEGLGSIPTCKNLNKQMLHGLMLLGFPYQVDP